MGLLTRIAVSAFALLLVAYIVPGIDISGLVPALFAATLLGLLNALVRPILVILTLPITVLTLGLFLIVINASLFYSLSYLIEGFYVRDFLAAAIGSLLVSIVSSVTNRFV